MSGENHVGGAEDATAVPVNRDEAKKTFEPFESAESSDGLLACKSAGSRQDAGIHAPAVVH